MNQTQHPFGDPSATQYHQQSELIAELRRRATLPPAGPSSRDPLASVHGEIDAPARHGWTVVAAVLFMAAMAGCLAVATMV